MTCSVHSRVEPARECLACRAYVRELDELRAELIGIAIPPDDELAARRHRGELLARAARPPHVPRRRQVAIGALVVAGALGAVAAIVLARSGHRVLDARTPDPIWIEADHATWSRLDTGDTTVVRLDDGALRIHVDHGGAWHRLVVRLPDGQIDDVGTAFRVAVAAGHVTAITVEEGAVILRRGDDRQIALVHGDHWTAQVAITTIPALVAAPAPASTLPHAPSAPADPIATAIERLDHHDPIAAAEQLRAFVAHHSGDARGEDAAYLLIIALQRIPDPEGVRAAARDYLRLYPDGLRCNSVAALAH